MAASRASRAVVKYPDVVPLAAGTPLPPGRPLRACDPWVCLRGRWPSANGMRWKGGLTHLAFVPHERRARNDLALGSRWFGRRAFSAGIFVPHLR